MRIFRAAALLVVVLFVQNLAAQAPVAQREALVDIYESTNGIFWNNNSNWLDGDPCNNNWFGVTCNAQDQVTALALPENNLVGSLPDSIGDLDSVITIDLEKNQLRGGIPATLAEISALQFFYARSNQLEGNIPSSIGGMDLIEFKVRSNKLSGVVPSGFLAMPNLFRVDFRWNAVSALDEAADTFLDGKSGFDFSETQTTAPDDLVLLEKSATSVTLAWTPTEYLADPGRYRVYFRRSTATAFIDGGVTQGKSDQQVTVSGLEPGLYEFVVVTETDAHESNENQVQSAPGNSIFVAVGLDGASGLIPDVEDEGFLSVLAGGDVNNSGLPALINPLEAAPRAIGVDNRDRLYFNSRNTVRRVESDGTISQFALDGVDDFYIRGSFLYYCDNEQQAVMRVNTNSMSTTQFADLSDVMEPFGSSCEKLAIDSQSNAYVAISKFTSSFSGVAIWKVQSGGQPELFAGADWGFDLLETNIDGLPAVEATIQPFDLEIDPLDGALLMVEYWPDRLTRVDPNTGDIDVIAEQFADGAAPLFGYGGLRSLATDSMGNMLVTDSLAHVYRIDRQSREIAIIAGNSFLTSTDDGSDALETGIIPDQIAVDSTNGIYFGNGTRIRHIDGENNIVTTVVGRPGFLSCAQPSTTTLLAASGLGVDDNGIAYFFSKSAILALDPLLNVVFPVAGILGESGLTQDGEIAFGNPINPLYGRNEGFAVAANGDVFFAESILPDNRLRRVRAESGELETIAEGSFRYLSPGSDGFLYAVRQLVGTGGDVVYSEVPDFVRIDPDSGQIETLISGGDQAPEVGESAEFRNFGDLFNPNGFAVDQNGNIYLAMSDTGQGLPSNIYHIDAQSKILSPLLNPGQFESLNIFGDLQIDENRGYLYYAELTDYESRVIYPIVRVDLESGNQVRFAGEIRPAHVESNANYRTAALDASVTPIALSVGPDGSLFVLDKGIGFESSTVLRITDEPPLETQTLPDDYQSGANVGLSSARQDNWLAIGAPNVPGAGSNTGEVLVYQDNDCRPILRDRLKPPSGESANRFGSRVTFADDTLVIGTSDGSGGGSSSFRLGAYGLDSQGRHWSLSEDLSGDLTDVAGASDSNLVSDGRYFAVSAPEANGGDGEVVVFDARSLSNPRTLDAPDGLSGFGKSLAISGNRLAVGADSGASTAVVQDYTRQGSQYALNNTIEGLANTPDFAAALALDDSRLFIGAPHPSGGQVFDYTLGAGQVMLNEILNDPLDAGNPSFGASLAVDNGKLVVGAPELAGVTANVQSVKVRRSRPEGGAEGSGGIHVYNFKDRIRDQVGASFLFSRLAEGREAYGRSVDINKGRIVAGAPETDNGRGDFDSVPDVVYSHELSGLWYDPELDGEGFNVLVADNAMVVYFYGYDSDGERLWLIGTATGTFRFGEDIYVDMYKAIDGDFGDPVPSDESLVKWGLLSMTYGSLDSATFILNGFDGTKISRAVFLLDAESNAALYSGLWYDQSRDGEGYNVISGLPGTIIYYYGSTDDGERLWLISDLLPGDISDGTTLQGTMYEAQGGDFYNPVPSNEALRSWGTINARFTDCAMGNFTLSGNDGSLSENVVKLAGVSGAVCD